MLQAGGGEQATCDDLDRFAAVYCRRRNVRSGQSAAAGARRIRLRTFHLIVQSLDHDGGPLLRTVFAILKFRAQNLNSSGLRRSTLQTDCSQQPPAIRSATCGTPTSTVASILSCAALTNADLFHRPLFSHDAEPMQSSRSLWWNHEFCCPSKPASNGSVTTLHWLAYSATVR